MIAKGLASTKHPLLVHIIPMRRCNLACTYCNEFDDFSKPVAVEEMFRRIDRLGDTIRVVTGVIVNFTTSYIPVLPILRYRLRNI